VSLTGTPLIHEVGKRIIGRYLERQGASSIELSPAMRSDAMGVDIRRSEGGGPIAAKVRVDYYFGSDPARIADRNLTFYRTDTASYALEAIADTATRAQGWVQSSLADELLYYRLAVARPEAEIAALLESPDGVFFSELGVERDELRIIPMRELREWFERSNDRYPPRPVITAGRSAWYRIVPMRELDAAVPSVRVVGPIYHQLGLA
jgi:hypothetical protein